MPANPDNSRVGWNRVYATNVSAAPTALAAGVYTRAALQATTYSAFPIWSGVAGGPAIGFDVMFFGSTNNATVSGVTIWAVQGFGPTRGADPYTSTHVVIHQIGATGQLTVGNMSGLGTGTGDVVTTSDKFVDTIASWTENTTYQTPVTTAFSAGPSAAISPTSDLIAYLIIPEIGEADSVVIEFTGTPSAGTINAAILPHVNRNNS